MKKGVPYKIWKIKLKSKRYYASTVLAYGLASLGSVISLILNIIIICKFQSEGKELIKDWFGLVLSLTAFTISVAGVFKNIKFAYRNYFKRAIVQQKEYESEIRESILQHISKSHSDSGFVWREYDRQCYLMSDKVNRALFDGSENLFIKVNSRMQAMDAKQKEAVYNIVTKKIEEGKSIFNSKLVRLRTDILTSTFEPYDNKKFDGDGNRKNVFTSFSKKLIKLEKTDYASNLTTNDLIYSTIYQHDFSSGYRGMDKTVDSRNTLYDLKDSPAANIVGVSTFAITSDGYIVLNLQGKINDVNNECLVPSGSGSSDFKDLKSSAEYESKAMREEAKNYKSEKPPRKKSKNSQTARSEYKGFRKYLFKMRKYTCDFKTFLKYGMVRELIEESHLYEKPNKNLQKKKYEDIKDETRRKYINNTYLCGYIRILDRGGKPDFFGFTLLDLTKNELAEMFKYGREKIIEKELNKNCSITDYNEINKQFYLPLKNIDNYNSGKAFIANECEFDDGDEIKISLQTYCLLDLIRKNKDKIIKLMEAN